MFGALGGRVDDKIDGAGEDHIQNIGRVAAHLVQADIRDAVLFEIVGGSLGGIDGPAKVTQPLGNGQRLFLILILYGDDHITVGQKVHARTLERLDHGFLKASGDAEHLAGGFHFRPKVDVCAVQLFKREHRHLDGDERLVRLQAILVAHLRQCFAEEGAHRKVNDRDVRNLADIRHRSGGTGIRLDDIHLLILDDELDIQKALDSQCKRKLSGVVHNRVLHLL